MKKLFFLVALAALLMPMPAAAQSAFDGTWKIDMNKVDFPKKAGRVPAAGWHVCVQDMHSTLRNQGRRHGPIRQRTSLL